MSKPPQAPRPTSLTRACGITNLTKLCAPSPPVAQVPCYDDQFEAVNTLRFIGYLLAQQGFPCAALWDPKQPTKWMYGHYEHALCVAFPPGLTQKQGLAARTQF